MSDDTRNTRDRLVAAASELFRVKGYHGVGIAEVLTKAEETIYVDNPSDLPDPSKIEEIREPIVRATVLVPQEHLGAVLAICEERRGMQVDMQFIGGQVSVVYDLPMGEVVLDLFDRLKSSTRGFASLE